MMGAAAGLWADRMMLAARGWMTRTGLDHRGVPEGMVSLGFWARTLHWNGMIAEVSLHAHDVAAHDDPALPERLRRLGARVREACERAASEFPDAVPCQMADPFPDGRIRLALNGRETELGRADPRPGAFPTEALFGADLVPDRGRHAEDLCAAFSRLSAINDSLDWLGEGRMARDCAERRWGYSFCPSVRDSAGVRVASRLTPFVSPILDEALVGGLVRDTTERMLGMFSDYAPGGCAAGTTPNGLPPGFRTRAQA